MENEVKTIHHQPLFSTDDSSQNIRYPITKIRLKVIVFEKPATTHVEDFLI
jgi:hypothetical protein